MTERLTSPNTIKLTTEIVSAFVSNNNVSTADLPALITSVHSSLENVGRPVQQEPDKPVPPVPIKRTITPDFLISLEDGKRYKSLRRHLSTRGLTPEQYREKWGLRADYPMVAPTYSAQRSLLARSLGLGQKGKGANKVAAKSTVTSTKVTDRTPKRRERRNAK